MLTALTYGLLATALTAHAAPFPQATGTDASVSTDALPGSMTPTPTSSLPTNVVTFTGVEVTSPPYQSLLAAYTLFEGSNIAITRSDTTFMARIGTFTGFNGPDPETAAPTTVTNAQAFEVSPSHLEIVYLDPSVPDALQEGFTCDVQGTTLNCTIIDYTANTTDIATVYSAIYQVAPTEVIAPVAPTSQVLNEAVDNEQLADLFVSAFSRVEGDAATASPTVDYISVIESLQSSLQAAQASVAESLATAAPTISDASGAISSTSTSAA